MEIGKEYELKLIVDDTIAEKGAVFIMWTEKQKKDAYEILLLQQQGLLEDQ
ncbi:hypothetical protein EfmAA242_18990 [Enterococcus faecium]|nr:hypothetical protein EfmAA242_18990 [Enterococcus faecium]